MSVEITISVKDEEGKTLKRPFLVYENTTLSPSDPEINRCVQELLKEFQGEPDEIKVRYLMVLK